MKEASRPVFGFVTRRLFGNINTTTRATKEAVDPCEELPPETQEQAGEAINHPIE